MNIYINKKQIFWCKCITDNDNKIATFIVVHVVVKIQNVQLFYQSILTKTVCININQFKLRNVKEEKR